MATAHSYKGGLFSFETIMSTPIETEVNTSRVAEELAGIMLNQNGPISGEVAMENEEIVWQTFRLPVDYPRGISGDATIHIPKLAGFQIDLQIEVDKAASAGLDWFIDWWDGFNENETKKGWIGLVSGTEVGAPYDGECWFDVNFTPIDITDFWWRKFRLGLRGRPITDGTFREPVDYDSSTYEITIQGETLNVIPDISPAPLIDNRRYVFNFQGTPSILEMAEGEALYSEQHGITSAIYTAPNPYASSSSQEYIQTAGKVNEDFKRIEEVTPFATPRSRNDETVTLPRVVSSDIKAYESDGVTPLVQQAGENVGEETSLRFRILATAPDSDRDCTGSLYRTVVVVSDPSSVRTSVGDLEEAYWLSGPNPSQFACESLYLDISEGGEASVVDHLLIDPVTPGIYMNIYYSNDPSPGVDTESWDGLLWTPVDKQFLLRRKENFALPEPITAKFVKLEFTHLQPVWYSAGTFQIPTQYRKHPKWVMDYYLSLYEEQRSQTLESASTINVSYDALELAYNYYLDDIRQDTPNFPTTVNSAEGVSLLSNVLSQQSSNELQIDGTTLALINLSMQRFRQQPVQQGRRYQSVLQSVAASTAQPGNYPTEGQVFTQAQTSEVSSLERDSVIVEKQFPITNFYLTSRHYYQVSEATFEEDRAYFAGVKEVALTREHYATRYDNDLYIESASDNLNIETTDLISVNHTWVTYTES